MFDKYFAWRLDKKLTLRILFATAAWIVWICGYLYTFVIARDVEDSGPGDALAVLAFGMMLLVVSMFVSLVVSVVYTRRALKAAQKTVMPSNWEFLTNYVFSFYILFSVIDAAASLDVFIKYAVPVLVPQTILLVIYIRSKSTYSKRITRMI